MLFYCVNLDMSILMVILIVFQFFHEVIRSVQLKTIYPPSISLPYSNGHAVTVKKQPPWQCRQQPTATPLNPTVDSKHTTMPSVVYSSSLPLCYAFRSYCQRMSSTRPVYGDAIRFVRIVNVCRQLVQSTVMLYVSFALSTYVVNSSSLP